MLNSPYLEGKHDYPPTTKTVGNLLVLSGVTDDAAPEVPGNVHYLVNAKVVNKGGNLKAD